MICKFKDGIFQGWNSPNRLNRNDYETEHDYNVAIDDRNWGESKNLVIEFPDEITVIKKECFSGTKFAFKGIIISKNIRIIEDGAFSELIVDEISVDKDNPCFDSRDNCNCIIETKTNKVLFGNFHSFIPDGVVDIDYNAFHSHALYEGAAMFDNDNVKKYTKYNHAYYFGTDDNPYYILARAENDKIEECLIHPDTRLIYISSFNGCKDLREITIPANVYAVCDAAFYECDSLEKVVIENGVQKLLGATFGSCPKLKQVVIPSSVEKVNKDCFCGSLSIETITYLGTKKEWEKLTKDLLFDFICTNIKKAICKDGVIDFKEN